MANLLHLKGSRNKIYKTLPSNAVGDDGDIIVSAIQGKGIYLCIKANNRWYVSNKMEELRKIEKTSISDLKVNRLKVGNTTITKDEYDVGEGDFTLDVAGDVTLSAAGGDVTTDATFTVDKNTTATATATVKGAFIDYDHTGISASGQTISGIGLDIDMNCESVTHVGTVNQTGIDINMVAATDGTQINTGLNINVSGGDKNYDIQLTHDATNYCRFSTTADGATTIETVDSDGAVGHLTLDPDGDLLFSGCDVKMDTTKKLYLDGGSDTYIYEASADTVQHVVGGDIIMQLSELGADGNTMSFRNASAGFTRIEATFSNSDTGSGDPGVIGVIDSGGTNDTDIDFRHTNKFRLEMTADITTVNLIFPAMSGNFLLVCTTNGDHDVTNWKVWESDESAATTTDVMWAGGSVPAFTTGAATDIVSFYWDTNEQQCYGVASLAFATP